MCGQVAVPRRGGGKTTCRFFERIHSVVSARTCVAGALLSLDVEVTLAVPFFDREHDIRVNRVADRLHVQQHLRERSQTSSETST